MQLVFLYGPSGVGKYTIGVELAARNGFELLHNHLTVNLVSAVFERDSDVWRRMLQKLRCDMVAEAAHHKVNLIMTGVFTAPGKRQRLAHDAGAGRGRGWHGSVRPTIV